MIRAALIALLTLVLVCIGIYAYWTARVSKQRPDKLLTEFKRIDSSLKRQASTPADSRGATARRNVELPEVQLAIRTHELLQQIDSIRHELVSLSGKDQSASYSYTDKEKLARLKKSIAGYNQFVQDRFAAKPSIQVTDLLQVADIPEGTKKIAWENYFFENSSVFGMITELNYIRSRILKLQYKATH